MNPDQVRDRLRGADDQQVLGIGGLLSVGLRDRGNRGRGRRGS